MPGKRNLSPEHQFLRSAACLACMAVTVLSIWWLCCIPCDAWPDLLFDALMIILAMVAQAVMWTLLEYIIRNDSLGI